MKLVELGCKQCGAVIKIQPKVGGGRVEFKADAARIRDSHGTLTINCKKCSRVVATIEIVQK